MLLRALAAHPKIVVASQILSADDEPAEDKTLARAMMEYPETSIRRSDPLLKHRRLPIFGRLVVKHAIWVHQHDYVDFVLVRNPFSIVKSMKALALEEDADWRRRRLVRWAKKIDPSLVGLCRSGDEVEAIARLYVAKMSAAGSRRIGVVRYEDILSDPRSQLQRVVAMLGLSWSENVANAHTRYRPGQIGHGGMKLDEPIRQAPFSGSIDLEKHEFEMIAEITKPAMDLFGYRVTTERQVELIPA
jgi:hypothetical protein